MPTESDPPVPVPVLSEGTEWVAVSNKLMGVEAVSTAAVVLASGLAAGFLWAVGFVWGAFPLAAVAVLSLLSMAVIPRRVRAIGYQLRADDLLFRRGVLVQRIVAVPYGRMQLVDITRGPVARLLGLSELRMVTAAAATAVTIPGLAEDRALELRDRLVDLAESRRAGL